MKWVVSSYVGVSHHSNELKCIENKTFDDYETAREYYWGRKAIKRKEGVFMEMKPYKGWDFKEN